MSKAEKEAVKTEEKATEAPAGEPVKASEERKLPYEVLQKNCVALFGVTSSTFIGATAGMEGKEYSVSEIKQTIESWLNKPIKKEDKK